MHLKKIQYLKLTPEGRHFSVSEGSIGDYQFELGVSDLTRNQQSKRLNFHAIRYGVIHDIHI